MKQPSETKKSVVDRFFKDKNNNLVLKQRPNLPIIIWFISVVLGVLIETGKIAETIDVIGFGALFTWAYLELFYGESIFRRTLGLLVLVLATYNQVN